jgi:hypothetical protein
VRSGFQEHGLQLGSRGRDVHTARLGNCGQ